MDHLRSLLSVPGNVPKMLQKAPGYGADALILDLEDSVPVDRKPEARLMVREFIESGRQGAVTFVRVNAIETGLLDDDLDAIVRPGLAGIQHPKTDSPEVVRKIDEKLTALEEKRGLSPGSVEAIPATGWRRSTSAPRSSSRRAMPASSMRSTASTAR
jgi:citrate lyase subunit beta / citryl-CoA lyase